MADTVKVKVTGEDDGVTALLKALSKQLAEVQKQQKKTGDGANDGTKAQSAFGKSVDGVVKNLKALALGYAALRVVRFVDDQLLAADALSKLAQKTGASVEALSVLAFAGETADVSVDDLTVSTKKLATSLVELQKGNRQTVDSFASIGLSAASLKGLSVDQAFRKISDAMGGFQDSAEKSDVAVKIFGKAGSQLIPLLNEMANGGFDEAAKEAARFGRVVTAEAGKAAEAFNDQLRRLKGEAQGAALALGSGIVPAVSDVIAALDTMKGEGEQSFGKVFGEGVGKLIRFLAPLVISTLKTIGETFGVLAVVGVDAWDAIIKASQLDFKGARKAIADATEAFQSLKGLAVTNFNNAADALDKAEKDRTAESVAARKKREDDEKKRIRIVDSQQAAELAKARAEAEQHAREGEGKLLASSLAIREQEVQRAFEHGLTNLDAYFAARKETITKAGAQEVAALTATRDALAKVPVLNAVDRVKRDDQVAQLSVQIKEKELDVSGKLAEVDGQRLDLAKTLADGVVDAETRIRPARGDTSAAAKVSLDRDVEEYRRSLEKIGSLTAEQQAKAVSRFKVTLALDIDAKANKEKIDQLFAEIETKRQELDADVNLGLLSQFAAQQKLAEFEKGRLPTLTQLADEMERFALQLDNPELFAQAQALKVKLAEVGVAVQESARLAASLGSDAIGAVQDDLSTFLGSTITQVHTLGEAFASLATSVVASIQQILGKLIATQIIDKLRSVFSAAGGLPSLPDASGAFAAIAAAGFARGGYTGDGGRLEPAGIVHRGEYVIPANRVRTLGIDRLDVLAGLRTRTVRRPRRGYAEGGFVADAGGARAQVLSLGGSIAIDVSHEGTSVQSADVFLKSSEGERAVLDVVVRHRGKIRGLVG